MVIFFLFVSYPLEQIIVNTSPHYRVYFFTFSSLFPYYLNYFPFVSCHHTNSALTGYVTGSVAKYDSCESAKMQRAEGMCPRSRNSYTRYQ